MGNTDYIIKSTSADFFYIKDLETNKKFGGYLDKETAIQKKDELVELENNVASKFKSLDYVSLSKIILCDTLTTQTVLNAIYARQEHLSENIMLSKRIAYLRTDFRLILKRLRLVIGGNNSQIEPEYEFEPDELGIISMCKIIERNLYEIHNNAKTLLTTYMDTDIPYKDEVRYISNQIEGLQVCIKTAIENVVKLKNCFGGFEIQNFGIDIANIDYSDPEAY